MTDDKWKDELLDGMKPTGAVIDEYSSFFDRAAAEFDWGGALENDELRAGFQVVVLGVDGDLNNDQVNLRIEQLVTCRGREVYRSKVFEEWVGVGNTVTCNDVSFRIEND